MTSPATHDHDPVPAAMAGAGLSRARRLPVLLGAGVLAVLLVRAFLAQPYVVASDSMSPTLEAGQRVLAVKVGQPAVGDLVVADVTAAWRGPDRSPHRDDGLIGQALGSASAALGIDLAERSVIGRLVATGGDEVVCCVEGRVAVNGITTGPRLDGDAAPFTLTVPPGRAFLLSDDPSGATDSRSHIEDGSDTADGTVANDAIVATVVTRIWPPNRMGSLPSPTFEP